MHALTMAVAMFSKLPEEIIYEILKPVFHIIIIDTFIQRPALALHGCKYGSSPELPNHLPLVCKQWHRIITPLLYATVELRTEAGMRLLANTLAATPALGLLIRHLRLNAGYGRQLYTVVKSAPNIRIVSLNLHVLSKHTIAGLLRSLPCLNPAEVYIHNLVRYRRENRQTSILIAALFEAMKGWNSLNSLYFTNGGLVGTTKMARGIVSVLAVAPSVLSEVVFNSVDLERLLLDTKFCHAISEAGVQRIRCLGFVGCLCGMRGWEDVPDKIKQLIFYEQTERERQILRMRDKILASKHLSSNP